jgi:hypothetical protein
LCGELDHFCHCICNPGLCAIFTFESWNENDGINRINFKKCKNGTLVSRTLFSILFLIINTLIEIKQRIKAHFTLQCTEGVDIKSSMDIKAKVKWDKLFCVLDRSTGHETCRLFTSK